MNKRFELIVFDWDGTLLDSPGAIVRTIQATCRDLGIDPPDDDAIRQVIGLGLADAIRSAVPQLSLDVLPQLVERYRARYLASDHQLTLFSGARELIAQLADDGFILAIATGKSRLGLDRALEFSGLGSYFHATRTVDECFSKPHPQMLLQIMEEFAVDPEHTLMIGDTTHDLQMANNAGTAALAVSFGAHTTAALDACAPLACVDSFSDLTRWLQTHAFIRSGESSLK